MAMADMLIDRGCDCRRAARLIVVVVMVVLVSHAVIVVMVVFVSHAVIVVVVVLVSHAVIVVVLLSHAVIVVVVVLVSHAVIVVVVVIVVMSVHSRRHSSRRHGSTVIVVVMNMHVRAPIHPLLFERDGVRQKVQHRITEHRAGGKRKKKMHWTTLKVPARESRDKTNQRNSADEKTRQQGISKSHDRFPVLEVKPANFSLAVLRGLIATRYRSCDEKHYQALPGECSTQDGDLRNSLRERLTNVWFGENSLFGTQERIWCFEPKARKVKQANKFVVKRILPTV
jgi:hypothetical protein